jgi:hypothetical protein
MEKARAMRNAANLPHDLWNEIVNSAVYLRDRTPCASLAWKSPYEKFYTYTSESAGPSKPQLAHLRAYGCRAYAMTTDAQLKWRQRMKLDPRGHIGYLVGYDSTNIYRVWIPHKGIVISTRDVIFDEYTFFTGERLDRSLELISELDTLIERVRIMTVELENESLLREDNEVPETDSKLMALDNNAEPVQDLNLTEDLELAKTMEKAYMTPPQTDDGNDDSLCAFYVPYQYNQRGKMVAEPTPESTLTQLREAYEQAKDDRYADYGPEPIQSAIQGAFTVGRAVKDKRLHQRNLPDEPKSIRDLENHPLRDRFIEA